MSVVKCPKCQTEMSLKRGPFGEFYGCPNFPMCKGKTSLKMIRSRELKEKVKRKMDSCNSDPRRRIPSFGGPPEQF